MRANRTRVEESHGIVPLRRLSGGQWEVFLVLHQQGGHWSFPKGKTIDLAESSLAAATRELYEETGLHIVKLLFPRPVIESYVFLHQGQKVRKQVRYYLATVAGTPVLQVDEIREGKWVTLYDASIMVTFKEAQTVCKTVIDLLLDPQEGDLS